jgi:hypothetical protein
VTKPQTARAITIAVLAGAAALAWIARSRSSNIAATPEDTIYAMYDAARAGDVKLYAGFFTGTMAAALDRAQRDSNPAAFAQYLRGLNDGLKGMAISPPETLGDTEVKVKVEYVFADRNEVQWMHLEKAGGSWRIARVDGTERIKTLVPYGTPVR